MSRLDPEQQQAIAARVRYYRDLGVFDFYRRGDAAAMPEVTLEPASDEVQPATTAAAVSAAEETMPKKQSIAPAQELSVAKSVIAPEKREAALKVIREEIGDCKRCPLAFAGRHTIVFGEGDPNTRLMFVGEGPGADEDAQGFPFVGRAGQLLTQMIENTASKEGIPIKRADVYICNVVK